MKVYGIDFNKYACGGIGNQKLQLWNRETLLFRTEVEMLKRLIELKSDYTIGEIKPFITHIIDKEKYEI